MEEKKCTGDCLKCNTQQRIYCAAQMSNIIMSKIGNLETEIASLKSMMSDKENTNVFNPMQKDAEPNKTPNTTA